MKSIEIQRIAVLWGGPSPEAAISKISSHSVQAELEKLGYNTELIELTPMWQEALKSAAPDFVFLGLHGCPGEDGTVQGALDLMGYSYQGSGVLASAMAMDKSVAKKIFAASGLDVAKEQVVESFSAVKTLADINIPLPFVLKPVSGGSSVGVYIIKTEECFNKALPKLQGSGQVMMAEEFISGRELTVAVMGEKALGVMEILSGEHDFYNYDSKYTHGGSDHVYPAPIPEEIASQAQEIAIKAHQSLGCKGVTRTDLRYDEKTERLVILEVNTLPGMTDKSLVPEMAMHNGISFGELIEWMIEDSLCLKRKPA